MLVLQKPNSEKIKMKCLDIQFKPEDIAKKFREAYNFEEEKKRSFLSIEAHAMISPLSGFIIEGSILYSPKESKRRTLKNPIQRAYVQNLYQLGEVLKDCSYDFFKKIQKKRFQRKSIDKIAEKYYNSLEDIISYLPVSKKLQEIDELTDEQKRLALRISTSGKILIYTTNRLFAPEFQRDSFYLNEDVNSFFMETEEILGQEEIKLIYGKVKPIETKENYINYAIAPLVWDVREHAFNPKNDIYGRMKEEKFWKGIGVFGFPENEKNESGKYIVRVQDIGFGIKDEVLAHLFEQEFTTKQEDGIEHGIGLWGVKNFIERNNGMINVKTELGKGTTFEFTIPYSRMEDYVYIQD